MKKLLASASILGLLLLGTTTASAHQGHSSCQDLALNDFVPAAQAGLIGTFAKAVATSGSNALSDVLEAEHSAFCEPNP